MTRTSKAIPDILIVIKNHLRPQLKPHLEIIKESINQLKIRHNLKIRHKLAPHDREKHYHMLTLNDTTFSITSFYNHPQRAESDRGTIYGVFTTDLADPTSLDHIEGRLRLLQCLKPTTHNSKHQSAN